MGALIREVSEELGINIEGKNIDLAHVMYRTKSDETGDRMDLFFVLDKWSGDFKNVEPHKCDDIQWFSTAELPENMIHHFRLAIKHIEDGVRYSELDSHQIVPNPSKS